jgi:glycosyltransferase 2 family protein
MKRLLKGCVAVVLIGLLVHQMDWRETLPRAAQTPIWGLLAALLIMIWELAVSTFRWTIALRMHELRFEFGYLFRSLVNGYFFNNFLPSAIGGDAYRVYRTLPSEGYRSRAVSAVFLDRLSGFAALLTLGALAAALLFDRFPIARWYLLCFVGGAIVGALGLFAISRGGLKRLPRKVRQSKVFDALSHNWGHIVRARSAWLPLIGWSLLFQATSILLVYWLFIITGHPQPLEYCALMTAASGIAALLPLSIAGIGLMEGSLVAMAVLLGVEYDAAALVAIVRRLLMFALSVLCGLSYLVEGRPAPASSSA